MLDASILRYLPVKRCLSYIIYPNCTLSPVFYYITNLLDISSMFFFFINWSSLYSDSASSLLILLIACISPFEK